MTLPTRRLPGSIGFWGLALTFWLCPSVWAARPMNTDDANVVDPGACQLESWVKTTRQGQERWALPGCNLGLDIEWTLGGALQNLSGEATRWTQFQAKKRWRKLEPGDVGVATSVGLVDVQGRGASGLSPQQDRYLNVPMSWASTAGPIVHLNVGWVEHRLPTPAVTHGTWGLGAEVPVSAQLFLIGETYREQRETSRWQVGLRRWIVPQKLQIDSTIGQPAGAAQGQRWLTIGVRWLGDPLF